VTNTADNTVSAFTLDSTTGTLTKVPLAFCNCNQPGGHRFRAGRTFLYVANQHSNNISAYSIDATGLLTENDQFAFSAALAGVSRLGSDREQTFVGEQDGKQIAEFTSTPALAT